MLVVQNIFIYVAALVFSIDSDRSLFKKSIRTMESLLAHDIKHRGNMDKLTVRDATVCVIGAGPSGLCAVKSCIDVGLSVFCYESQPRLGGIWISDTSDVVRRTGVHDRLHLKSSKFVSTFSDFPLPDDLQTGKSHSLSAATFREYLERYASTFGLKPFILCHSEVVRVRRLAREEDKRWAVTVKSRSGDERTSFHRFVIVATGAYSAPNMCEVPGAENGGVKVIHSSWLRVTSIFRNSKVVVVGGGCSASDTVECALNSGARKITWVRPRTREVRISARYPFSLAAMWDELLSRLLSMDGPEEGPDTTVLAAGLAEDRLEIVGCGIASIEGDEACLDDGSRVPIDICVFATGFQPSFPFLSPPLSQWRLHRGVVAVAAEHWGAACVHVLPVEGAGIDLGEMQARWLATNWSLGRLTTEEERRVLETANGAEMVTLESRARRDGLEEIKSLARELGCQPSLIRCLFSPSALRRRVGLALLIGPWLPQHLRLHGPGRKTALAEQTILCVTRDVIGWRFEAMALTCDVIFYSLVYLVSKIVLRAIQR